MQYLQDNTEEEYANMQLMPKLGIVRFTLKRRSSEIEGLWTDDISYIKDHGLIALTLKYNDRICAVRISDGQIMWDKSDQVVAGDECNPSGMAFLCNHDLLLVRDMIEKRILILSPTTGDILQTVPLQQETGRIHDLHLINDRLLVHQFNKTLALLSKLSCHIFIRHIYTHLYSKFLIERFMCIPFFRIGN